MCNQAIIRGFGIVMVIALFTATAIGFQSRSAAYLKGAVTQSNKPLRSVWVIVSQSGEERGRYLTGDDGKFYIGNLPAGDYDIAVWQGKQQIHSERINLSGNKILNIAIPPAKSPLRGKRR